MNAPGASKAAYVRAMFGRIVPRYDLVNRLMTLGMDVHWRRVAARLVMPKGRLALDTGCGTADLALELEKRGARAVIAIDFCPPMLVAAKDKLARGSNRISLAAGDTIRLPFADNTFGCAVNGFMLRNVSDIEATLAELCRVLEPGGRLACLELTPPPPAAVVKHLFGLYFGRIVPRLGGWVSGEPDAYRYFSQSLRNFPDADRLAKLMVDAGFSNVSYRRLGFGTIAVHVGQKPSD